MSALMILGAMLSGAVWPLADWFWVKGQTKNGSEDPHEDKEKWSV